MIRIKSIDDDRLAFYKSLRYTPKLHTDNRAFVAEGSKIVKLLLESNIQVISIFGTEANYESMFELISKKNISQDQLFVADISLMRLIVGYHVHSGIMAIGKMPEEKPIEELTPPFVMLNSIVNAENVGSIIRNAAAFGFKTLIYDNATVPPYLRRSVRVSMGNVFLMDTYKTDSLSDTIDYLKESGFVMYGAEITNTSIPVYKEIPLNDRFGILFGNEGHGIETNVLAKCDKILHIPISPSVQSLNVAASSALIFYELMRQKANQSAQNHLD